MKTIKTIITTFVLACAVTLTQAQVNIIENFDTNPIGGGTWYFNVGDNSNSQYNWANTAPAYTGDSNGSLTLNADGTLPTAYFQRPLGATLDKSTSFTLSSTFSLNTVSTDGFLQYAFGLVNSATTTNAARTSAGTYDSIEWNYFPTNNGFGTGPTVQQVAWASSPAPYANLFAGFDNTWDLTLNNGQLYQSVLDYNSVTMLLNLSTFTVAGDGSLTLLGNSPAIDLSSATGFSVDSLAIMTYNDGFGTLDGQITFQQISVTSPIPEPQTYLMMLLGVALLLIKHFRKKAKLVLIPVNNIG